jgi:hypothetical protein
VLCVYALFDAQGISVADSSPTLYRFAPIGGTSNSPANAKFNPILPVSWVVPSAVLSSCSIHVSPQFEKNGVRTLCIRKDKSLAIGHHRPTVSGTISDLAVADEAIQNCDQVGMGAGFVPNRPGGILPGAAASESSLNRAKSD